MHHHLKGTVPKQIPSPFSTLLAEQRREKKKKNPLSENFSDKGLGFPSAEEDEKALSPDQLLEYRKPERPRNQHGLRWRSTLLPVIFRFQPTGEKPGLEFCCELWLQLLVRMDFVSGESSKRWLCYFNRYSEYEKEGTGNAEQSPTLGEMPKKRKAGELDVKWICHRG